MISQISNTSLFNLCWMCVKQESSLHVWPDCFYISRRGSVFLIFSSFFSSLSSSYYYFSVLPLYTLHSLHILFLVSSFSLRQVRVLTGPRGIFRQLCDRGGSGGLRDGAAASAGFAALLHPHGAGSLCCRKEICQTGLQVHCLSWEHDTWYCANVVFGMLHCLRPSGA